MLIIGRGERKRNNKQVMCCLFRNDRFDNNTILYCVEKFAKVVEEGPAEHFFSAPVATVGVGENRRRSSTVNVPAARNNHIVMVGGGSGRASAGASAANNMNVNVNLSTENLARDEQEGAITFRITTGELSIKWENRDFAFVLAISEVNAWLAMRYFCDLNMKLLDFRTNLARQLVYNPWLEKESAGLEKDDEVVNIKKRKSSRINMNLTHEFCSAPPFGKKITTDRKWILTDKNAYEKKVCKGEGCKKQVRTYCSCCVGHWMCPQ